LIYFLRYIYVVNVVEAEILPPVNETLLCDAMLAQYML